NTDNPFIDYRYSERSIPIYLIGQLDVPLFPNQPNGPVIDGVRGAGFYKPLADGTYAIPTDVLRPTGAGAGQAATNRRAGKYEPLIAVNGTAPKLLIDPDNPAASARPEYVFVTDRNGVPIRYYHWLPDASVTSLSNLNVPVMVGRVMGDTASGLE